MSVNSAWRQPLDGEQRRNRQIARQRDRAAVKLSLVAQATTLAPAPIPLVVPAEFVDAHKIFAPRKKSLEAILFVSAALALHVSVAWWMTHQPPAPPTVAAQVPPIEVVFTPPEIPPQVVKPEPPKPLPPKEQPRPRIAAAKPAPSIPAPAQDVVAVPVQNTPPVATAPAPVAETVTDARADADYLQNPAPQYPPFAQRQGWEGTVNLQVLVLPDGRPGKIELRQSSGRKTLDEAALAAVQNWRFVPAKRGSVAVEGWVNVPIEFKLGK
jgi:periplasmic protein TonB